MAQVQDETIRSALRYYTLEGTLGRLLDAEEDGLAEAAFIVFEIEDLMAMGERNLIPVLLYLFRRFERSLKGQPAYLLAGRSLGDARPSGVPGEDPGMAEGAAQGELRGGPGDAIACPTRRAPASSTC